MVGWGRRNLLEDKVITEYVLESEAHAKSFQLDLVANAKELYESFSKQSRLIHKQYLAEFETYIAALPESFRGPFEEHLKVHKDQGPDTSATDSEADMFSQLLDDMGVSEDRKPKMTSGKKGLANEIGKLEEFNPTFKICSKLMHRTTISIAAENTLGGLDALTPLLRTGAFLDLMAISRAIEAHLTSVECQPVRSQQP